MYGRVIKTWTFFGDIILFCNYKLNPFWIMNEWTDEFCVALLETFVWWPERTFCSCASARICVGLTDFAMKNWKKLSKRKLSNLHNFPNTLRRATFCQRDGMLSDKFNKVTGAFQCGTPERSLKDFESVEKLVEFESSFHLNLFWWELQLPFAVWAPNSQGHQSFRAELIWRDNKYSKTAL